MTIVESPISLFSPASKFLGKKKNDFYAKGYRVIPMSASEHTTTTGKRAELTYPESKASNVACTIVTTC